VITFCRVIAFACAQRDLCIGQHCRRAALIIALGALRAYLHGSGKRWRSGHDDGRSAYG
jgi:hypothetical protein